MSSILSTKDTPLGWAMHVSCVKALTDFNHRVNEHFVWIDEVIAEAKKTLTTDDVELLPKTPSSKKTRRRVNSRTSSGDTVVPKRALRSSSRQSHQNTLDLSAEGKLPKRKKPSYDLDTIDELGENIKSVKVTKFRVAADDNEGTHSIVANTQVAANLLSKRMYDPPEEIRNDLNEKESAASARESDISEAVEFDMPVVREGMRKRKKAADTKKDPAIFDIIAKENTSKNDVRDDKLFEQSEAVGSKNKRAKTSVKETRLRTQVCDVQQEIESKLLPEEELVSTNAPAEISEIMKDTRPVEQKESFLEKNGLNGKQLAAPEIADAVDVMHDDFTSKKAELDEAQKESGANGIPAVESTNSSRDNTVPGGSGRGEDMLVDSVFEGDDQKGNMRENSVECAQELDSAKNCVQPPKSIHENGLSSSPLQKSISLNPTYLSPVVPVPVQTFSELNSVNLSNAKIPEMMLSEFKAVSVLEVKETKTVLAKSHTSSISKDKEAEVTPAGAIKLANKAEQTVSVNCLLHSNVNLNENQTFLNNSKTVSSDAKSSLAILTSRSEELLSSARECSEDYPKMNPVVVSSTKSSSDSTRVVSIATSPTSKCSQDSPTVVSTLASSSSSSSGDSPTTAPIATSSDTPTRNSLTVVPTVGSSSSTSSANLSTAVFTMAPLSGEDSSKVNSTVCSSFMSWEPVSSMTDKPGTTPTVASISPNGSHPKLLSGQKEVNSSILTKLPPTGATKKALWSSSADSVDACSTAGVSPSRIFLKVHAKNSSVDLNNSEMSTAYKMPEELNSPVKLDVIAKSVCNNAVVELSSSPVYQLPLESVALLDHHIVNPLAANVVPLLDSEKITRNESKFFPTPGSPKSPEHELSHQGDCKDTSSPIKRFYCKMKVRLGSFLSGQSQTKTLMSSASRSPGSLSIAGSFKTVSASTCEQENTTVSSSPGQLCTAPIEDMEVDLTTVQSLPVDVNTTKNKRLSKGRRSHSRRSSVHTRLSNSHRRSSAVGGKSRLSGPQKSRLSKRFMSALKRQMSRTPAMSTPIKEIVLVQNDASLAVETPVRNTRSKIHASAAVNEGQSEEGHSSLAPLQSEYNEDEASDDDVVCDTPPAALAKIKVQLEQTMGDNTKKMNAEEESNANQDHDGKSVSAAATDYEPTQAPSTLKQKRPLGSRIKMLQDMICQSPAFSSKNKKKKSNSSITSNASGVTSGVKTKKLGIWSTSQRRVSLKRANTTQKSKAGSQWIDLNDSTASSTGGASSVSVFTSSGSATRTPTHPSSFLNLLSKKPTPAVVSSGLIKSFIPSNTPVKMTREEQGEQKRKELEAKKKKLEEAEQRKQEQRLRKAEELKRQREERQMLAQKRRDERQQKELEQKREMMHRLEETSKASSRAAEERLREEREKQKLREKRIAEAEQRRKQEEEARQQMLLQMEKERELFEEQQRLKRELEDQERQQKIAEQRKQEEERRKQLERERLAEQERLRLLEEQKLKEEQEKQRQKEEREKREKAERDRVEVERQRERERQREIDIEKQREAERQRFVLKQAEEEQSLKDKTFVKLLEKHNQNLKCSSSMNSNTVLGIVQSAAKLTSTTAVASATRLPVISGITVNTAAITSSSFAAPLPLTKPVIKGCNTTVASNKGTASASVVVDHDSDSYDMTPTNKVRKPASDENYDINDLNSDDSTDEDTKPRKKIPLWAQGAQLKALLIKQFTHPPDVEQIFGPVYALDLNEVFNKKKPRFNKRTSSAAWDEPLMPKPSSLKF